ncbi:MULTISPECIES: MarP family serine protease [unclassified Gordonia (in: high G+C Gram-positive bacteria)]|uniref:MarP family serine protease n=1 Tax=unclassified Gordonia (in: high G+C Gram-positive bacteria) TaxID=2657482 RepID=UPI001FFF3C9F|nr:MarP family serine protease [Gordonia sp. PP30]UQE75375.1 MarP family serine protease [Gordonia sp. PP30]
MSGSVWVDVLVLAIALLAAIGGYRAGAAASALAFLGVVVGVIAGILVVPHVVTRIDDPRLRLLVALLLLVGLVIVGEVSGMVIGRAARSGLHSLRLRRVDSCIGSVLQFVAILIVAWLVAIPIRESSQTRLAEAVDGSRVIGAVDKVAPNWMRGLPGDFTALIDSSGLKQVISPFGETEVAAVDPPDQTLDTAAVVTRVRPSVVKILGVAHGCGQALEGSGFVISPERVMTNAHVVAGTDQVAIRTPNGREYEAKVVWFNSRNDVAVLDVPGLTAPALKFSQRSAVTGDDAIVLGYPENGPFTVTPVRVRNTVNLVGPDIYQSPEKVKRKVYTVRGTIRSGNSGGPMIAPDGTVLGVVFGASENVADDTGFVLTASQVEADVAASEKRQAQVGTAECLAR